MKTKHSKSDMYPAIERWQKSGLTQTEYCEQEKLSRWIFKYWLKKYREEHPGNAISTFIPVEVLPENKPFASSEIISIHYPNGIKVECPCGMSYEQLRALIRL